MPRRAAGVACAVLALVALAACSAGAGAGTGGQPLLVAAASDLRPAFTELGERFAQETGHEVVFSFGSSGQLAQQLVEGAPMDVYASADAGFVDRVLEAGVGDPATRATYAYGRVVIWARADRWAGWDDLAELAADGGVTTVAIANPEHAPYGAAARQALESAGVWQAIAPRVVLGENVSDTQRLAATGNADVAVVALSLAIAAGGDGAWVLVDDGLHDPLRQDLVVVASDPDRAALARRFADHVQGAEGREIMRRFGLLLPGEGPPPETGG